MSHRFVYAIVCACLLLLLSASASLAATYTVRPGDSLFKIGQRFGVSVPQLQSANGLGNRSEIYPGQTLIIPGQGNTHTVRSGDTLFKIAARYGISYQELMRANGLTHTMIQPGQVLSIPAQRTTHTVRSGDSLYKIATQYGLSTSELMRANGLTHTEIRPGQVLTIPVGAPGPLPSRWSVSRQDFDLLARLINAEAGGEPYLGKVAVGAVVLNRVKSHIFPNTIPGVIYQRWNGYTQFEPILNGSINQPASADSIRAAQDALSGWDPTNGAMYFWNPVTARSLWVWNRTITMQIGRHVFAH